MNALDLAYLAGVIDSDGCIRVECVKGGKNRGRECYAPIVLLAQIEPEAIQLARSTFGGYVAAVQPTPAQLQRYTNPKPMLRWVAKSRIAAAALRAMRPYLRIKTRQADNA